MGFRSGFGSALVLAMAAAIAAGCQVSKSANPLAPTVAGPIAGVTITTPNLLEPGQDWQIRLRDQPLKLMIQNADTSGVRTLTYTFEVATDSGFSSIIFKRTGVAAGSVTTTLQLPDPLPSGRTYWWRARAEDGANIGAYSKVVSFVAVAPVELGRPSASSPSGLISTTAPEFKIAAGSKVGPAERLVHYLQVANDQAFASIAWTFVVDEGGSETTVAQNYSFLNNHTYFWRVQTKDLGDSQATSAWSDVQVFTTAQAPPVGGGGDGNGDPSGDPSQCGPPFQNDPLGILQCHRNAYPEHMSRSQAVSFLTASARDINRAGVGGGPYGLLRKESGNNCEGWSCDILCAGQGTSQRQYDVLIDEKYAHWGSPLTYPGIRMDVCSIP